MFCPKCGNQVPEGGKFCGKCGHQLGNAPAATTQATKPYRPAPHPSAQSKISSQAIISLVMAAIAVILTFQPWITLNSYLTSLVNGVGGVAKALGSSTSYAIQPTYSPWTFFQLCSTPGFESDGAALLLVITAAVVIACILIVAGAISTISGKKKTARLLSIGLIVLAITAALFAVLYLTESDGTVLVGGPTFSLLCALSSLIGAIVGFSAKKAQ